MPIGRPLKNSGGFTLIELLIVVAVVSTISIITTLVLNPVQIVRRARDTNRISDLAAINNALSISALDHLPLGNASSVYVSIPDSSPTCADLGLPPLTAGLAYACASSQSFRANDGTGWIPVDFASSSAGSPIDSLPIDPVNATSTGLYYTYTTDGQTYKLSAFFESQKDAKIMASDGGIDPLLYEIGSNPALPNVGRGLIGYWPLDDCAGTTAKDISVDRFDLSLLPGGNPPLWSPGMIGLCSLTFTGSNYAQSATQASNPGYKSFVAWFNPSSTFATPYTFPFDGNDDKIIYEQSATGTGFFGFIVSATANSGGPPYQAPNWHMVAGVQSSSTALTYVDGALVGKGVSNGGGGAGYSANPYTLGALYSLSGPANFFFFGSIDDARIYNKALSADEIAEMYQAEKQP